MTVLMAIDPGREKCGLAVVSEKGALHKAIVPRQDALSTIESLVFHHSVDSIIMGNGTGSGELARELESSPIGIPIELVDESHTSRRARIRFLRDNPPRGIRRVIPQGLLTPDRPYDDYVALILAEDHLDQR